MTRHTSKEKALNAAFLQEREGEFTPIEITYHNEEIPEGMFVVVDENQMMMYLEGEKKNQERHQRELAESRATIEAETKAKIAKAIEGIKGFGEW